MFIEVREFPILPGFSICLPSRSLVVSEGQRLKRVVPLQPLGDSFRGVVPIVFQFIFGRGRIGDDNFAAIGQIDRLWDDRSALAE